MNGENGARRSVKSNGRIKAEYNNSSADSRFQCGRCLRNLSFALDREVDLQDAEMSGAANAEIHDLAAVWFGEDITLNVETLLMVPQVEAFAKLARWRVMMATS